jgi:hypothetical protein
VSARSGLRIFLATSTLLITSAVLTAWLIGVIPQQEATGQEPPATPTNSASPTATPAPQAKRASPSSVPAGGLENLVGDAFGSASANARANGPGGIPDLSVMDVIGNAEDFPTDGGLVCEGPISGDNGKTLWACSTAADEGRVSYGLVIVGDDPSTIFSVEATAHGASEEEATEVFGYVGALCLDEIDPLNPEAWMLENVPTGGQTFAEGVELSVYGTQEARTLQVVASDVL